MLSYRFTRFFVTVSMLLAFAVAGVLRAQDGDAAQARVVRGGISPRLSASVDLGEAEGALPLPSLMLHFAPTATQQAELTQLLADQQNPASSRFHQWLTPEQFRAQFGLDATRLGATTQWLTAQGFTVTEVARGGLFVRFTGSVTQAERAFATQIHRVSINGETRFANVTAPSLPATIAGSVAGISGLDDFHPLPHGQAHWLGAEEGAASPAFTTSAGTHYIAPGDFYAIYGENTLLSTTTGSGVTVAVAGQSDINASDLTAFQAAAGLASKQPVTNTYGADPGFPSAADLNEAEADLEWVNAVAPGASLIYVNSSDALEGSLTAAIDGNLAPIVATSYGACEASFGVNALAYYSLVLQMASAEGITITAATGDSGATDCDGNVGIAVDGLAVDFPASSPQVTAVGGTELSEGTGSYWNTTNGTNGVSAKGYIPEVVWNEDNGAGLSATGGGASGYFSKPVWQTGTGVPADFSRDVPDVALASSINHDGYLICTGSACTNGFQSASGGYEVYGGTSLASPAFAGLLALVEQKTGARLGNANPVIYALANSSYAANVFHDVTSGTNASPCTAGSVNCANGGVIGFAATAGYDQATGWGSVNAFNLASDWKLVTPAVVTGGLDPSQTNIAGSLTSAVQGTPVTFTMTVASATTQSAATPTGSVQITVDSVANGAAVTLMSGTASYVLATGGLSAGNHVVQATYSGDSTFAGSKGAFSLTITAPGGPDFALTPATANVTVKGGAIAPAVQFTVSSLGGFAGNVTFTASLLAPLAAQSSFTLNPVVLTAASASDTTNFTLLAYTNSAAIDRMPGGWYRAGSGVVFAGLLLIVLPRRRRWASLLIVLLAVGSMAATGCGSSAPPAATAAPTPTPAGTYMVMIQGLATIHGATVAHTATITYTVQ